MADRGIPARPALSKPVSLVLRQLNRFFDFFYNSEFNPFYRSGTLAIGLLFVLLITGTYLLFFYSVSNPYDSVQSIQAQTWAGRWIRALHRYATDAALIAVFFHVFQLLAQGKTWGPRTLAWVSGVILLVALFISGWTGYVMVWDKHGQLLAESGGKLLQGIPFIREEIARSFSGVRPVPASFFFMNLFLHVALPLAMIFGMWIHTARLARTVWFPIKSVFCGALFGLFVLSIFLPAVLLPEADMLSLVGRIQADWFYAFWIPLIEITSPNIMLGVWVATICIGISIPWWWKPSAKNEPPVSHVDEEKCTGCTQCARDCPYEAIKMVPHSNGKHLLAEVSSSYCVSCGICTASCDVFAVGPETRTASDQLQRVDQMLNEETSPLSKADIVLIGCFHNDSVPDYLRRLAADEAGICFFGLNCCGTLHSKTIEKLLDHAGGVLLVGCAARNCMNRDGLNMLIGRIFGKRVPFLSREIDKNRIGIAPHSEHETEEIKVAVSALRNYVTGTTKTKEIKKPLSQRATSYFKRTVATVFLMAGVGYYSQAPMGTVENVARLRISGRLPSHANLDCRALTTEERARIPVHMQRKEICEQKPLYYRFVVTVDGTERLSRTIDPKGLRAEIPIFLQEDIDLAAGDYAIHATADPIDKAFSEEFKISFQEKIKLENGKIRLVLLSAAEE